MRATTDKFRGRGRRPEVGGQWSVERSAVTLPGTQLYFTKPEVARLLKISLRFVTRLMRSGALPYLKLGRTVRFRLEDVQRQLNERCLVREERMKDEG